VRRGVVMLKQPGLFLPKFGAMSSHVFMHLPQNVAVEPGIHSLACLENYLCTIPLISKKAISCSDIAFHLSGVFGRGAVGFFHREDCSFVSGS
jgi:hypothetical protein